MKTNLSPKHNETFRLEQLDDEFLLYHPGQKKVMYCNNMASLIWQLCDGKRTTKEIITLLNEAYEEKGSTIKSEVIQTLTAFYEQDAISFLNDDNVAVSPS